MPSNHAMLNRCPEALALEGDTQPDDAAEHDIWTGSGVTRTSLWQGWNAATAHPSSPAGGGGPGNFGSAHSLDPGASPDALLHPNAPAARLAFGFGPFLAPGGAGARRKKPLAPPVKPRTFQVSRVSAVSLTINVKILEDKINSNLSVPAKTYPAWQPWDVWTSPKYTVAAEGTVSAVTTQPAVTATLHVWTEFKSERAKKGRSAYGRGTTAKDKRDGNITLEFHESCHQKDFVDFVTNVDNLPEFIGSVGMGTGAYLQLWTTFENELRDLPRKMEAHSALQTDEVGKPKKSEYDKRHRPTKKG